MDDLQYPRKIGIDDVIQPPGGVSRPYCKGPFSDFGLGGSGLRPFLAVYVPFGAHLAGRYRCNWL